MDRSPPHDHVGPDKRCTQCKGFILDEPVKVKVRSGYIEVCSSDCAIDYYEGTKTRSEKEERR